MPPGGQTSSKQCVGMGLDCLQIWALWTTPVISNVFPSCAQARRGPQSECSLEASVAWSPSSASGSSAVLQSEPSSSSSNCSQSRRSTMFCRKKPSQNTASPTASLACSTTHRWRQKTERWNNEYAQVSCMYILWKSGRRSQRWWDLFSPSRGFHSVSSILEAGMSVPRAEAVQDMTYCISA